MGEARQGNGPLLHGDSNISAPKSVTERISKDKAAVLVSFKKGKGRKEMSETSVAVLLSEH